MATKKTFNEFCRLAKKALANDREADRNLYSRYGSVKAAMAEGSGTTGGYTVPTAFAERIASVAYGASIIWPLAQIFELNGARSLTVPTFNIEQAQSAGTAPWWGGWLFQFGKVEGDALSESEPTFGKRTLVLHRMQGYAKISDEMLSDIVSEDVLINAAGDAVGFYSDRHFLRGTGVGSPLGILNASKSVTRSASGDFKIADAWAMVKALNPGSYTRACFVIHPSCVAKAYQMGEATSPQNNLVIGNVDIAPRVGGYQTMRSHPLLPIAIAGLPVLVSAHLESLGTAGDVILIDPTAYAIAHDDKMLVAISGEDPNVFLTDESILRIIRRIDGQPVTENDITLTDGSTTVRPFVKLS